MDSKSGMQSTVFLHYYALCSNMVIYVDGNVPNSWYQSQPWIRIQNIRNWRNFFLGFYSNRAFCPVSEIFYKSKIEFFLHIRNLLDETIRSVGGTSPEVTGRALTRRHAH